MLGLWLRDPCSIPNATKTRRKIAGGPLLNLSALQALLANGGLAEDELWVATDRCQQDMENEQWSYLDVLSMLSCLEESDFKGAEWCLVKGGALYPCDVYVLNYDVLRRERNRRALEVYLKFSVTEEGRLSLVLVSCHGSR